MSYLRHISTRRLLALLAAVVVDPRRQRRGDRPRGRRVGDRRRRPSRSRRPSTTRSPLPRSTASPRGSPSRTTSSTPRACRAATRSSPAPRAGCGPRATSCASSCRPRRGRRAGDAQVLLDGDRLTVIDTGVEHRLPGHAAAASTQSRPANEPVPSLARIQQRAHPPRRDGDRSRARSPATSPGARPTPCASRRATTAACSAAPSWRGTPSTASRCAPRSTPAAAADPVLELQARPTSRSARWPPATSPSRQPAGAKVVDLNPPAARRPARHAGTADGHRARRPSRPRCRFKLVAPDALVGLPRQEVRLVDLDGTPGRARDLRPGPRRHRRAPERRRAQPQTQRRAARRAAA